MPTFYILMFTINILSKCLKIYKISITKYNATMVILEEFLYIFNIYYLCNKYKCFLIK